MSRYPRGPMRLDVRKHQLTMRLLNLTCIYNLFLLATTCEGFSLRVVEWLVGYRHHATVPKTSPYMAH